ncbi:hypothetical protein PENCOP_c015G05619 [Penicillium coprophilum]|uniref:Uncharacterized protein n=1 Tax=Penicillium coprophilum TaxID=36646 RepID=A0A1V6U8G0_9EURO|nr:hypothetical protein PENCOP_c015G05619 [Penicillium coprophilum]
MKPTQFAALIIGVLGTAAMANPVAAPEPNPVDVAPRAKYTVKMAVAVTARELIFVTLHLLRRVAGSVPSVVATRRKNAVSGSSATKWKCNGEWVSIFTCK